MKSSVVKFHVCSEFELRYPRCASGTGNVPEPLAVLVSRGWPNGFGNRWVLKIARELEGDGHERSVGIERKCLSSFTHCLLSCFK